MTYGLCHVGHLVAKYLLLHTPAPAQPWACPTTGTPSEHFSEPVFWRTRETRIQWRKGAPQFRNRILSITTDTMLHSRDVDENVRGVCVCVVCAIQAHVAGSWTDGLVQPRRPHWPGALPVIVQRGGGCIRGSVGGCLADPFPPSPSLPHVVPSVGVPKWTGAS